MLNAMSGRRFLSRAVFLSRHSPRPTTWPIQEIPLHSPCNSCRLPWGAQRFSLPCRSAPCLADRNEAKKGGCMNPRRCILSAPRQVFAASGAYRTTRPVRMPAREFEAAGGDRGIKPAKNHPARPFHNLRLTPSPCASVADFRRQTSSACTVNIPPIRATVTSPGMETSGLQVTLNRLLRAGRITRVGRGIYRLVPVNNSGEAIRHRSQVAQRWGHAQRWGQARLLDWR